MTKRIYLNKSEVPNDFELTQLQWEDLTTLMIGLKSTISILEQRQIDIPHDPTVKTQIQRFERIFEEINIQYPNWNGDTIGQLEQNLNETLNNHKINSQL